MEQGRNLVIDWRWGDGKPEALTAFAEELVRRKVDLIVARSNDPIAAAKRATSTIPIVMLNGNYPVEMGFVDSLARPGHNVTGTSYLSADFIDKQIQVLAEIVPHMTRLGVLWNARFPRTEVLGKLRSDALERSAARYALEVRYFEVSGLDDLQPALEKMARSHVDALWYSGDAIIRSHQSHIAAFAIKNKIASMGNVASFADSGGLVHYAPHVQDYFDRTAGYVDHILKGRRPADLPVEEPKKFSLVVNLKTAKALNIDVPRSILVRADRLID